MGRAREAVPSKKFHHRKPFASHGTGVPNGNATRQGHQKTPIRCVTRNKGSGQQALPGPRKTPIGSATRTPENAERRYPDPGKRRAALPRSWETPRKLFHEKSSIKKSSMKKVRFSRQSLGSPRPQRPPAYDVPAPPCTRARHRLSDNPPAASLMQKTASLAAPRQKGGNTGTTHVVSAYQPPFTKKSWSAAGFR